MVCAGVMTASGGALSNGEQDCDEDGTAVHGALGSLTGSYTSLDASGRGTASMVSSNGTSHVAVYMVSGSRLLMLAIDPLNGTPVYSGELRSQSGPFSNSSLSAQAVLYLTGVGSSGQLVDIGTLIGNGSGSVNVTIIEDDSGTLSQRPPFTCTSTVASNGRVTISGTNCGNHNPVLYLNAANTGFMVGTGMTVESGQFEPQTGGPFSNSSMSGTFFIGTDMVAYQAESVVGSLSLANGSVTGLNDDIGAGDQSEGRSITASFTINSDGSFSAEGGAINAYVISSSKFVIIDAYDQATTSILVGEK
jgi:hypothetical protein